jgi:ubiquinone/menaquinone biosynthesis C-methylase UbiE
MTHKFAPANKNKLDNDWRRQNLPPHLVLEALGLDSEDIVADVGCGIGYFTIPASKIVQSSNKVYALDTSEEMLTEVEKRAVIAEVANIVLLQTDEYDLKLPDESVSFVLMVNVLHEVQDQDRFVKEAKRILKPAQRIALVDWEKKPTEKGPPIEHRLAREEITSILEAAGFELNLVLEFAGCFYGIVAIKK